MGNLFLSALLLLTVLYCGISVALYASRKYMFKLQVYFFATCPEHHASRRVASGLKLTSISLIRAADNHTITVCNKLQLHSSNAEIQLCFYLKVLTKSPRVLNG